MTTENEFLKSLSESLTLIQSVGPEQFAKIMKEKRGEIEKILLSTSPFKIEDYIQTIIDFAIILNELQPSTEGGAKAGRLQYEHLVAATFSVGYAMGLGPQCASALPIIALSGANIEFGKKLLDQYMATKNIKDQ